MPEVKHAGKYRLKNMQAEIPKKTQTAKDLTMQANRQSRALQVESLRNEMLRDELMQELTQQKTNLESFVHNSKEEVQAEVSCESQANTLRDCVEQTLRSYFAHLDGQSVTNIYNMVLSEVEAPLLEVVMRYTQHNQCRAAELLGLSRGTLRKKLQQHGLL